MAGYLDCGVVPLSQWGSTPLNNPVDLSKPVHVVVIQHTVTGQCFTDESCVTLLKNVRKQHVDVLKFSDIGNSFYIGSNGKVYEGSGWHVGAHSKGLNSKSIGLSFIGDFREESPTEQALQAAKDFLDCSVKNHNLSDDYDLVGHSQVVSTISPGAKLQSLIETWPHWRQNISM
ncbi:unnamed protein product [Colias eurytheme]|nr:unnamed protein product [Colias eurytheme]